MVNLQPPAEKAFLKAICVRENRIRVSCCLISDEMVIDKLNTSRTSEECHKDYTQNKNLGLETLADLHVLHKGEVAAPE